MGRRIKNKELLRRFDLLEKRQEAVICGRCMDSPRGCGGDATNFTSKEAQEEYKKTGLCEECQLTLNAGYV